MIAAGGITDPSADGPLLAWHTPGAAGSLRRDGVVTTLPGGHPAVAGDRVAWLQDGAIVVADQATLQPYTTISAPGADALALSSALVAYRTTQPDGRDAIIAVRLGDAAAPPLLAGVATPGGGRLGRPACDGTLVAFHASTQRSSRIVVVDAATGAHTVARELRSGSLLNPAIRAGSLLYVRSTASDQELVLGPLTEPASDAIVYSTTPTARRDSGVEPGHHRHKAGYPGGLRPPASPRPPAGVTVTLWTTALGPAEAYVTRLRHRFGGVTEATILTLPLPAP